MWWNSNKIDEHFMKKAEDQSRAKLQEQKVVSSPECKILNEISALDASSE
jgi:hypothetical protein